MKAAKYLAIALTGLAILAATAWFLRDALIQRISNPLLADYDLTVTDVSLDALATDDASIGYLEILHAKGTTIAIDGLTLPIGRADSGLKTYTAKKVSIVTVTRTEGEPLELAQLIDQFLSLSENLAGSEIIVDEFSLPPYPTVRNVRWVLTEGEQDLHASVQSIAMSAVVTRIDATNHDVVFSIAEESATTTEHSITGRLLQSDVGIAVSGSSSLELQAWEPLTKFAGILPDAINIESGTAALRFDVEFPYDENRSPSATATLTPSSPFQLSYTNTPGTITSILLETGSAVDVTATFPEVEWNLRQATSSLLVNYEDWSGIQVSVNKLSCQSGPSCAMNTRISISGAVPFGSVDKFEFTSTQTVTFPDEGLRVEVSPDATLALTGLSTPATDVTLVEAKLASNATLELIDAGWRISADSFDASMAAMSLGEVATVTAPLFLENIFFNELDGNLSAGLGVYVPSLQAAIGQEKLELPGIKGDLALQGSDVTLDLATVGLQQDGRIKARHNIDAGDGEISIGNAAVSFASNKLSKRVSPWRRDWDLIAGVVSIDGQASWEQLGPDSAINGRASASVADLSGFYADTVFTGLSTSIAAEYDSATGFTADPSSITIALIEMGLPIENITADYTLDPNTQAVEVDDLRMTAFGGVITADPFSFDTASDSNTVVLRAESIEISEILTLKEFEAIDVTGSFGAVLPVSITVGGITITGGTLTGEAPGGVIRYTPGRVPDETDTSAIGLVTEALSHFRYDSLTSEVNYDKDGDLKLQMRLTGRNPDMQGNRPVVLNLGVESNVPQMLKSLQAARAVEEILEKRLAE